MRLHILAHRGVASTPQSRTIKAGLILSRIPIVTQDLTSLEKQYYDYQSELEKRLMWTFPQYFYYRKGTLAEKRFLAAQKGPVSRQPGVWFPKGIPDVKHNRERRTKQVVNLPHSLSNGGSSEEGSDGDSISRPIVPNSRITQADKSSDLQSLERGLSSTLYLLVKNNTGQWKFPSFPVKSSLDSKKRPLHATAEAGLRDLGGPNINTWSISNTPAGVLNSPEAAEFLIKSHIISGRFELQPNSQYNEFAWLTKKEIQQRVDEAYYQTLACLLAGN
ncbi:LADA_0H02872g1_1 [Lachancea dasiensis]|uniref:Large ribosomal subunit protein mL46 n=1 Tax=Lachancea dasiensis TaxID=1072105 RepID=A0A1G4K007_9SACH|nr:LADA_0H02872g1_1 [Lachancea dasiensis]